MRVGGDEGEVGARVASVNIGALRAVGAGALLSGIDKQPVTGPVAVMAPGPRGTGRTGLAGDAVGDVGVHGGDRQAVYAYAREDLDGWEAVTGGRLPSGAFGENLTTRGLDVNAAVIGERWRVGRELVLQVTVARLPCATFARWMDRKGWLKEFTRRAVPGAYLRVASEGSVAAGDPIEVLERPAHGVTISELFRAVTLEPDLAAGVLGAAEYLDADVLEDVRRHARIALERSVRS